MNFLRSWKIELENRVKGMIGLAKKAGKIVAGAEQCEKEIRAKKSELIIIANDITDTGLKAITDVCTHYSIKYIRCFTKSELGNAVGASGERSVLSVNDKGFAGAILKKFSELQLGRKGE